MRVETANKIRMDMAALERNIVWNGLISYIEDREQSCFRELQTADIGKLVAQGSILQKLLKELNLIKSYPDRMLNSVDDSE